MPTLDGMEASKPPRLWKLSILSWVCIYPLINLAYAALGPFTSGWPMPLRTLLMSACLAPPMSLLMGLLQRRLRAWLSR